MKKLSILMLLLSTGWIASAQKKSSVVIQKKPLSHAVYDSWKDIASKAITADGNYAAITVNPQDGDGKVVFYNLKSMTVDSVHRADNISLSADSKYAVFKIKPQQKIVREMRRLKKKKEELPKDSLGIYSFSERKTQRLPEIRSYKIPEKSGGWIAYQLEAKKEPKPKAGDKPNGDEKKPKKKKVNSDENGYTLILKKVSGPETSFGFVKDYAFAKWGQGLLFSSGGNDSTMKAGVYWYDLAAGKLQQLYEGKSKYKFRGLSISEDGTQTSFMVDTDTTKAQVRHFGLYHWKAGASAAAFLDIEKSMAIPQNWVVSEFYVPTFSKDGAKLFFGSSPVLMMPDTTRLPEEVVQVEIWGGDDQFIYPQQNRQAEFERKRTYLTSLDLAEKKIMLLGDRDVPSIEIGDEGNAAVALGESNVPYRKMITWDPSAYNDIYLIDLKKQMRKPVASHVKGNASLSPKANYVFWFSQPDTSWFAYSVATEKTVRLNEGLKVQFADEENDSPDYPGNYGFAGWTSDDQRFLAYDRYDIWAFDPQSGSAPVNLTKTGRQDKIVFRYIRTDIEERSIDPSKELLLSAFNEATKASGFYKLNVKDGKLTKLIMDNYRFSGTVKAKNAAQILYTRENFREFPDVWLSDMSFTAQKKITDVNPQMKNYLWGTVELVHWTSLDNIPLSGLLYKPEGFDPKKKYPMIVNFYEKESDNLYAHFRPEPHRSTINKSVYASNGYVVFVPDIVYKIGFPGESARNCVMPGVTSLIEKGFVDEKNIGVQGHSWGGYQIAYLVTRTNLFKAAEAGAPVVNMISGYGGVRWETGLSRMFQYEHSQSRIGGTLWEKPMHFIENSPIFFVDKIQTPLLLLHNDADGAVPWYQGIEFYMALRRLNKPVWMLNYNGEPHWPIKRENRIDFQTRMMQFFDYYLKGAPEPQWMVKGVPAIEKGINKGY